MPKLIESMAGKGAFWFRICGYGLQWLTYHEYPVNFSERYGYRVPIVKTSIRRVFVLTP